MFYKARLRLTILYSIIFLVLFWTLSAGVYEWMNGHFGDRQRRDFDKYTHQEQNSPSRESPSDIVMDDLRDTLIILDILLLILIPTITWFLTGRTLAPVQEIHEREKRFFTDASHDLRTPLTILKGEIDLSLKKDQTARAYKTTLQSSKEEVASLIDLVENMLFFAGEDRKQTIQKELLDLTDLIAERVSRFQNIARQKRQNLSFTLPKESITIRGNKQLLQRLVSSLLDNAVKYTPKKGKIAISLTKEKQIAVVIIKDTGIGIKDDQQEKVFNRFYRADSARSQKGYGLGLAISKQIVEYHEGKIYLDSKVNKGTTITISFPIATRTQGRNQS